jgi:hypothetical protein
MTIVSNDFMSLANGVAVAQADAGSPTQFYAVTKTAGTIVRDATPGTTHVPRWAKLVQSSAGQNNMVLQNTSGKQHGIGLNLWTPTSFPANGYELSAIHTAGPTYYMNMYVLSTGALRLLYNSVELWTSTGTMSPDTEYFIYASIDNTTTTASYVIKTYAAGSGSPIANLSYSGTYGPVGTSSPAFYSFGVSHSGQTNAGTWYIGRVIGRNDLTEIGQYAASATASAGPDISGIEPLTTVTLDGSASTGSSWAWSVVSATNGASVGTITNQNTKTATYKAPANMAGTTITFRMTVDGAVTDDAVHTVLPHTEWIKQSGVWIPLH